MQVYSSYYHASSDEEFFTRVEEQRHTQGAEGYPVLKIGEVTIWPTLEQLAAIRDVCAKYLTEHAAEVLAATVASEARQLLERQRLETAT